MERSEGGGGMEQRGAAATLGLETRIAHPPPRMHAFNGDGGFLHQAAVPVRQQPPPPYSSGGVKPAPVEEMGNGGGGGAAGCPWSRMKWTDGMVRLLITVVYNAGDDGEGAVSGGGRGAAPHGHGGHGHGAAAAQQQKKGKWKSVSRAMMDNGFMVSPQQCEDKFNDLNKRYKRVVDLLGRGRACEVVENPALLQTMDQLTPKAKDEARKLLSSKHLFFREMCTYHNAGAPAATSQGNVDGAACFHHPPPAGAAASSTALQVATRPCTDMMNSSACAAEMEEDDDDSEDVPTSKEVEGDDEDDYDDVEELGQRRAGRVRHRGEDGGTAEEEEHVNKRIRRTMRAAGEEAPSVVRQLQSELADACGGDPQQVRQWMRRRAMEVEEQQVAYECRAYQLERQRLKWERFRANKERDMERARLRNDRLRIDARRMLLLLRQKDLDLDAAEANYSSSVDHHPGAHTPPPLATFQQ